MDVHPSDLSLDRINEIVRRREEPLQLSQEAKEKVITCRQYLDDRLDHSMEPIYGINTGFGFLCDRQIATADRKKLQINLIRSHACGTGKAIPVEIIRLMLILKVKSLAMGHSGVKLDTVERLLDFLNHDIIPVVYSQGSLGASGDLAPLAHLSLPLIGEGEVWYKEKIHPSHVVMEEMGWAPIELGTKEGLALLNGTQFMLAYGVHAVLWAEHLAHMADIISALSMDAFDCRLEPFHPLLHQIRPHRGQVATAEFIRKLLKGSEISAREKKQVQDPYSYRCIPQVHGATKDAIAYCRGVFETEVNSVSDNPNIFPDENEILSGGNFHGQPLALALDFLAIALSELASISERRTYQLLSGVRDLPLFLVTNPGLDSGLMIPQYTAAGIVSQNKQLCTPASVDTIPSSNNQEDHVSMGANAATKCLQVLENLHTVLAIELMNASQALFFREPGKTSPALMPFLEGFRKRVPIITEDRHFYEDIRKSVAYISEFKYHSPVSV